MSGVQQPATNDSQTSDSVPANSGLALRGGVSNVLRVPSAARTGALSQIEALLETIVDAISNGDHLTIPYQSTRTSQHGTNAVSLQEDGRLVDALRFPARTAQEAKRFGMRGEKRSL